MSLDEDQSASSTVQVPDTGTDLQANRAGNSTRREHAGGSIAIMKQRVLPGRGEPALKWGVWLQMFEDSLLACGLENARVTQTGLSSKEPRSRLIQNLPRVMPYKSFARGANQAAGMISPKPSFILASVQFNSGIQ